MLQLSVYRLTVTFFSRIWLGYEENIFKKLRIFTK